MNNQTPTTEKQQCETHCGMNYCDDNGCMNRKRILTDPIPPSAPQAETAKEVERIKAFLFDELRMTGIQSSTLYAPYVNAVKKYADLHIKETLEAADKELPTLDKVNAHLDTLKRWDASSQNLHDAAFTDGVEWFREQAAPIIAKWMQQYKGEHQAYGLLKEATDQKIDELHSRIREQEAVLVKVSKWELPDTGKYWDADKKQPMSYEAAYGSNGSRDYFKALAASALTPPTNQ